MKNGKAITEKILTIFDKKNNLLRFTTNHTGKMTGMFSLSTACTLNKYCMRRARIKGSICSKCYADTMLNNGFYKPLRANVEYNTRVLTETELQWEDIPNINALYFRFEAFGDIMNKLQVRNYFAICDKNPGVRFALWTKNPLIIKWAMKEYGIEKPRNLNIIFSSCMTDIEVDREKLFPSCHILTKCLQYGPMRQPQKLQEKALTAGISTA